MTRINWNGLLVDETWYDDEVGYPSWPPELEEWPVEEWHPAEWYGIPTPSGLWEEAT